MTGLGQTREKSQLETNDMIIIVIIVIISLIHIIMIMINDMIISTIDRTCGKKL